MWSAVLTLLGTAAGAAAVVAGVLANDREARRRRDDLRRTERLDRAAELLAAAQRVEFSLDKHDGSGLDDEGASAMADAWLAQKKYDLVCADREREPAFHYVHALDGEVRQPREGWNLRVRDARHTFLDSARAS